LGFPDTAYEMSKVALCAITRLQQKQIDQDTTRTNIKISSVTPGYCMTDMTSNKGYFTAEQGADTPYFLTQLSNDIDGGQFWSERKVCDWINEEMVF
jgi:carbonyl reductase 1